MVADNRLPRSIREVHFQARDESRTAHRQTFAQIEMTPHAERERIIPAVAEHHAQTVVTPAELPGHIVSAVENPLGISRPAGIEHLIADGFAVQAGLIITQAGDVEPRTQNFFWQGKLFAEQRCGVFLVEVLVLRGIGFAVVQPERVPVLRR